MILADSSVWIDHLRKRDPILIGLVEDVMLLVHPFVIGEMALGHLKQRDKVVDEMLEFPTPVLATDNEVLAIIQQHDLMGSGLGLVDVHLLGSAMVTVDAKLWTRDKRLAAAATKTGVLAPLD